MSREIIDFIEDMLEAIEDIEAFTRGLSFDQFSQDAPTLKRLIVKIKEDLE
jgi:uncharacterized protein with HEPN domain